MIAPALDRMVEGRASPVSDLDSVLDRCSLEVAASDLAAREASRTALYRHFA